MNDSEALKIADELTELLMSVDAVREIDNKIEYKLVQRLSSIRGNER